MRTVKMSIAFILLLSFFAGSSAQEEFRDISEYFGFDEMEIIKLDWGIDCLLIADFNGDGGNDIAVVNNTKSRIELLIQKESAGLPEEEISVDPQDIDINQIRALTRFEKQMVPVSQRIFSLVRGDLNTDGLTDLAYYGDPKGLYIMLQKHSEDNGAKVKSLNWRTRKKINIEKGLLTASSLVCGDLNNDGLDDLALAGSDAVYIILQKNDGSLAEPVEYPTTMRTLGLKIGDLNGDTVNDLLIITNDGEKPIQVRFGIETGQLGPQEQFFIEKPYALKLYNADGSPGEEILTVVSKGGRFISYKFTRTKDTENDWPVIFYPLSAVEGNTKRDLVAADFNGDGLVDITISDPGAAEMIFYKQLPQIGLAEPVRFPALADIDSLSVADIDGDGRNELAVLSAKEKIIGISEFENERFTFPKPIRVTAEPVAMELADIDRNGSIDCVYVSKDSKEVRTLRVLYGRSAADAFDANIGTRGYFDHQPDVNEQPIAVELEKLTSNPDGIKILDVDQDELMDVLIFVRYEQPILVRQVRLRQFEVIDSPASQASLIKDASLRSITVADIDDTAGEELLIAQKNYARSLVFEDGKTWKIVDQYNAKSTENETSTVAVFDIESENLSGTASILLLDGQKGQLQILKAGRDRTYRFEKEISIGKWSSALHLKMLYAPLTGSGLKSILLFDSEKFALITPESETSEPATLEQMFSYSTKIKDGVYGNFVAGDINSDDRTDFIMVDYKGHNIEILTLNGENNPVPAMRFKTYEQKSQRNPERGGKSTVEPRELKIADVTGDGKNDLVTIIHDRIIVYPQD